MAYQHISSPLHPVLVKRRRAKRWNWSSIHPQTLWKHLKNDPRWDRLAALAFCAIVWVAAIFVLQHAHF